MTKEPKSGKLLASFTKYCEEHPNERFWQALRNWAGQAFIYAGKTLLSHPDLQDTFYWEDNDQRETRGD